MERNDCLVHVTQDEFVQIAKTAYWNLRAWHQERALKIAEEELVDFNERISARAKRLLNRLRKVKPELYTLEDLVRQWDEDGGYDDLFGPDGAYRYFKNASGSSKWAERVDEVRKAVERQLKLTGAVDIQIDGELYNYIVRNAS